MQEKIAARNFPMIVMNGCVSSVVSNIKRCVVPGRLLSSGEALLSKPQMRHERIIYFIYRIFLDSDLAA